MAQVELKATEHKVHAVTVFGADRAEVVRLFTVPLKAGQNEVDISQLPSRLDEDSIRVDGIGGNGGSTVISDVIYHPPSSNDSDTKHQKAVKELQKQKAELQRKLAVFERQAYILETYGKSLKGEDTDGPKLEEFLEIYATRQTSINTGSTDLKEKIATIDEEIRVERLKWNADNEGKRRAVRITVVIAAEQDGAAEICLTYLVPNASWTPLYDLRAVIGSNKTSIYLHYRASIRQATGEDWKEVALTLSTASPQVGSTIPKLSPQWISTVHPVSFGVRKQGPRSRSPSPRRHAGTERMKKRFSDEEDHDEDEEEADEDMRMGLFDIPQALAVEGAVSTSYVIEGLSTIPTDTDTTSQAHNVNVAVIDLSADLEWVAIPKEIPSAFLQAKVKNTSGYLLLPGKANVFLDNNFVAKSEIEHVSPGETFKCSLGVDSQIKITYHPRTKKTHSQGGLLSSRTSTTAFSQKITVKNTRSSTLKRLIVRDQIPVSSDQRLKVSLIEPTGLGSSDSKKANRGSVTEKTLKVPSLGSNSKNKRISALWKVGEEEDAMSDAASTKVSLTEPAGLESSDSKKANRGSVTEKTLKVPNLGSNSKSKEIAISKGISARWKVGEDEDETSDAASTSAHSYTSDGIREGVLEWVCEIGSGQSTDLHLVWEVTAPAGINWA